jgi:di/tricarboxylate transporter
VECTAICYIPSPDVSFDSLHAAGLAGLVIVFLVGTIRPINLGALALAMTFLVGTFVAHEDARQLVSGFPVDLLVLLVGVTYLFGVASANGTVEWIVRRAARGVERRRTLFPWVVFALAAAPAMAGALGSAGVALLAPLAMRLAEQHGIDRRMVGLMVVHGAGAGNFSPLNVLGAIVHQAVLKGGLTMTYPVLFAGNLIYNMVLAAIAFVIFGGLRLGGSARTSASADGHARRDVAALKTDQTATLAGLGIVAVAAFGFGLSIGLAAMTVAALLQTIFPRSSAGADKRIAWSVVLLVCGVVTYVAALQRYGTIGAAGTGLAGFAGPHVTALVICGVAAVTSAFASSAGILGAMIPLALPFMQRGDVAVTGFVTALALSATVVDAAPFSTVGALVVANAAEGERQTVYRGLLVWGGVMVVTAPLVTWLVFVLPGW